MNTCIYCEKEDDNSICVYCDGRHTGKAIFKRVNQEKIRFRDKKIDRLFNEEKMKKKFIKRDVLGLEGLNNDERVAFFKGFDSGYEKAKLEKINY